MIEKLVGEGRLGKKTGRGVYRYDAEGNRVP
jgi:3-hydroxyacyl-CoA dehydrogenase